MSSHVDAWQTLTECASTQSQQYGPTSATSAAKAFGDFVKQESTRLQSAAPNASRYQRHDEFDEEDEVEVRFSDPTGLPLWSALMLGLEHNFCRVHAQATT